MNWYLYDAQTPAPLGPLPLEADPRWSATDPNVVYHLFETRLRTAAAPLTAFARFGKPRDTVWV